MNWEKYVIFEIENIELREKPNDDTLGTSLELNYKYADKYFSRIFNNFNTLLKKICNLEESVCYTYFSTNNKNRIQ